jgi:threonine dehydrogenase-like Zn-dependent dehydrogenase
VGAKHFDSLYDRAKQALMLESDRPHVLREMMYVCRPAGTLSVPGVYGGLVNNDPVRRHDAEGAHPAHRTDACEPLDR